MNTKRGFLGTTLEAADHIVTHPINRIKERKYVSLMKKKNLFDKIKHPVIIKTFSK